MHPVAAAHRPSLSPWLARVVAEWLAVGLLLAAGLWLAHPLAWFAVVVLLGSRQHALAILGHDGAHRLICRNRQLNDWLTELLCFWPLGAGLRAYRAFHFRHHRHVGTDRDPERVHLRDWSAEQFRLPKTRRQIAGYFAGDLIGLGIGEVVKMVRLVGKAGTRDWLGGPLWALAVWGPVAATGYWQLPAAWYAAQVTSFWAWFRLRLFTEHLGLDGDRHTYRIRANWWQRLLICPHGTWLHYEHHAHPSVPCWALPELRNEAAPVVTVGDLFRSFSPGNSLPPSP